MTHEQYKAITEDIAYHKMKKGGGLESVVDREMHIRKACKKHNCSVSDFRTYARTYARGGVTGEATNKEMVANNNKQIKHHTEELASIIKRNLQVPAWVVAKVNRSASDLSDVTHYLDGQDVKFAKGGAMQNQVLKSDWYKSGGLVDGIVPVDQSGVPKIDDASLRQMTKKLLNLTQTKDMHLDSSGNYTKARKELHKKIINEFKKEVVCINKGRPIAIMMGGSPASGKSSFVRKFRPYLLSTNVLRVDADEIRAMLPEYKGYNATQTHAETKDIVQTLISDKNVGIPCDFDLVYDGTMNSLRNYENLIRLLRERNYKIYIVYIANVSYDVVVERMKQRYLKSGRFVPIEVIDDFFAKGTETLETLKPKVDGYVVVDGSTYDYNIIEQGGDMLPQEREHKFLGKPIKKKVLESIEYGRGGELNEITEENIKDLEGEYVEFHAMGVEETKTYRIANARVSPKIFTKRDVTLIFEDGADAIMPLEKLDDFVSGKIVRLKDYNGESYAIKRVGQMAKGGMIEVGDWVKEKKGTARGKVWEDSGIFIKLEDKYGGRSNTLYPKELFKHSSKPRYESGGSIDSKDTFTLIFDGKQHTYDVDLVDGEFEDVNITTKRDTELYNWLGFQFDEWLENAPSDTKEMYYGDDDGNTYLDKRGAITDAIISIANHIKEVYPNVVKLNLDKYEFDFSESWEYGKGGMMAKGGKLNDVENDIDALYRKSRFINNDFNWRLKLLEMLQDQSIEAYNIYIKLSKEQKKEVLQEQFEMDNDMGSYGDGSLKTSKENLAILLDDAKNGKTYAKGGVVRLLQGTDADRTSAPPNNIEKDLLDKVGYDDLRPYWVGNFGWRVEGDKKSRTGDGYLFMLDDYDKNLVKNIKLKPEEYIFRYFTRTSAVGGMTPFIKINIDKGLLYFSIPNENDELIFESKGVKAMWVNLIQSKLRNPKFYAKGGQTQSEFYRIVWGLGYYEDYETLKSAEAKRNEFVKNPPAWARLPKDTPEILHFKNGVIVHTMGKGGQTQKEYITKKVGKVMHEFKQGDLRSSSGQKVTNPKQAIAIGLSEGRAGWKHKRKK